jgi:hypothetical protein
VVGCDRDIMGEDVTQTELPGVGADAVAARFAAEDEPRSGRPPEISEADVVVATLADGGRPPERLGITHWSARFLACRVPELVQGM